MKLRDGSVSKTRHSYWIRLKERTGQGHLCKDTATCPDVNTSTIRC